MGTLEPDWRERITISPQPYQPYQDAIDLAVQDVLAPELALWEPGVAGDGRKALDAWYVACLANMNDALDLQLEQQKATRRQRYSSLAMRYTLTLLSDDERKRQVDLLLSSDSMHDYAVKTTLGVEVRDRDRLHAWYRASLAAAGDANDWVGWYRGRINGWRDREIAAIAEAELDKPEFRAVLESPLPDYWSGTGAQQAS